MAMKKLIATMVVCLLMSVPALALAGPKGFSGSRGSSAFKSRPIKPSDTSQSKTGTIQDLGVNPSSKSPADMVKNRSTAELRLAWLREMLQRRRALLQVSSARVGSAPVG